MDTAKNCLRMPKPEATTVVITLFSNYLSNSRSTALIIKVSMRHL